MRHIQVLDNHTANQIAAGEVVERPSSVVKELVENALDAGATRIIVEVEEGGRRLIRISDNGCGIPADELRLAFERHATSKLARIDDLSTLTTLGFRGEALPSIASVARLTMTTRTADALAGATVAFAGGACEEESPAAGPVGTTVTVRDLFYNTPAREKFLKTAATELTRIVEVVSAAALAHPTTAFRLLSGGRELLTTTGDGQLATVTVAVLGSDCAEFLRALDSGNERVTVAGYVVAPQVNRSNRNGQYFFVNGRPIRSTLLGHALSEACRDLLPSGRHSLAAVFLTVPPDAVDVNVHPAKAEVRFAEERLAHSAVYNAVRGALSIGGMTTFADSSRSADGVERSDPASGGSPDDSGAGDNGSRFAVDGGPRHAASTLGASRSANVPAWQPQAPDQPFFSYLDRLRETAPTAQYPKKAGADGDAGSAPVSSSTVGDPGQPVRNSLAALTPLGQLHASYIIAEGSDGLYIIDQHAAHERVLFEQFLGRGATVVQTLLLPLTVDLTPAEMALISELQTPLTELGFDLAEFGGGTVVIRSVPASVAGDFGRALFTDLLAELAAGAEGTSPLSVRDRIVAAMAACKAAIKARERLTPPAAAALLAQLGETANPWTCPHGRPTIVRLGIDELMKRFRRT